jgi:hypothetical protein
VTARRLTDPFIVSTLLALHAVPNPRILDASYGRGVLWRGLPFRPVRMDRRAGLHVGVVGDWNDLGSLFAPASFDVVVFDPPHISDAGSGIVGDGGWGDRYGTRGAGLESANVAHLFTPFLEAARLVLEPGTGIVLAKIADQVHGSARQWQDVLLVNAALAAGYTACDRVVKAHGGLPDDPKWLTQYHMRSPTSWIVLRNGPSCVGPGRSRLHVCQVCSVHFRARRQDAVTCSGRCRQRRRRAPVYSASS